jgi:hypothetical protein
MNNQTSRKVYYKQGRELKINTVSGFSGRDEIDSSESYMEAAKQAVGVSGNKIAVLICLDGGRS